MTPNTVAPRRANSLAFWVGGKCKSSNLFDYSWSYRVSQTPLFREDKSVLLE